MGQHHSSSSLASDSDIDYDEDDYHKFRDDSTSTTRSTTASTYYHHYQNQQQQRNAAAAAAAAAGSDGSVVSGTSGTTSTSSSTTATDEGSARRKSARRKARKERKERKAANRKKQKDPFALRGVGMCESLVDASSLPALLGSMISDSHQTVNKMMIQDPPKSPHISALAPSRRTSLSNQTHNQNMETNAMPLPSPTVIAPSANLQMPTPCRPQPITINSSNYHHLQHKQQHSVPLRAQSMMTASTRNAIHPIDTRIIYNLVQRDDGSLPPPVHEAEMKINQYIRDFHSSEKRNSSPVALRRHHLQHDEQHQQQARSAEDAAYLARLYDLRTWNMYKLIKEARQDDDKYHQYYNQQQQPTHLPSSYPEQEGEGSSSCDMIFELDME